MLNEIFNGLFDSGYTTIITVENFLLCIFVSLLLGILLAVAYAVKSSSTKSFLMTLALLPAIVCVVIMMVNGHIGAGVAVAGAFSLVRFRSAPGSAKEIVAIFLAMGTGLISGMGYLGYAALFALIMSAILVVYNIIEQSGGNRLTRQKSIKITIPEDLDYSGAFDDIFTEYAKKAELIQVKTTNMGSMFRLTYDLTLADVTKEKQMIDRIRERNGNLEVFVSKQESQNAEL